MKASEYFQIRDLLLTIDSDSNCVRTDLAIFYLSGGGLANRVEVHIHCFTYHQGMINVRWEGESAVGSYSPLRHNLDGCPYFIQLCIDHALHKRWMARR